VTSQNPVDRHDWDLAWLATGLGFSSTSELGAALGSIDRRGYNLFALTDHGRRVISAPRPWLKALQRNANRAIFDQFPVSDSVYSRRGRGVVANAKLHLGNSYMTVMDVEDCFPSTSKAGVLHSLEDLGLPAAVAGALTRLCTYHGFLPQGPPTSPAVLNVVFRPIDEALIEVASAHDALYSRYMDDLAFSGMHPLKRLDRDVCRVLSRFGYGTNSAKRRVWGPADPHTVTKIVVSTSLNPTPEFLRALSAQLDSLEIGNCRLTYEQLRGKINWVKDVNQALGRSLEQRIARSNRVPSKNLTRRATVIGAVQ
jgi:RNA-directed DNA polymerase